MFSEPAESEKPRRERLSPWLWPALVLSALIVGLNAIAWLDRPLAPVLPWVWGALGLVTLLVLVRTRRLPIALGAAAALLCAWLTVSDAAGKLLVTQHVSSHPDAWSYDSMAGYLADHGRGRNEGLPLVDQFATHLRDTRFASSCLLALSQRPLGIKGKFAAHALFYLVIVFVTFCSMTALAGAMGFERAWALLTAAVSILLGWTANAIVIGNYDNLVFAALLPGALTLGIHALAGLGRSRWEIPGLGLILAAIFYTYPEGAALCGPAILPLIVVLLARSKKRFLSLRNLLASATVAAVLSLPYAPHFLGFLTNQFGSVGLAASSPGSGNFTGLISTRALPSVFALGTEYPTASASWLSFLLASVFLGLLLLGVWRLSKIHHWFAFSVGGAAALFVWQAWSRQYDYGAYKVTYCHAWLIFPALVAGARHLGELIPRPVAIAVLSGLALGSLGERWHHQDERLWHGTIPLNALSELAEIRTLHSGAAIYVELHNEFAQMWALSFLRGFPLIVSERRGYLAMPHVQPALDRAAFVSGEGEALVLGAGIETDAVWQNSNFHLSKIEGARLVQVQNPNGMETIEGKPFIWIAHSRESRLTAFVRKPGVYELTASTWWGGPSLPGISHPTLLVTDSAGERRVSLDLSNPRIELQMVAGLNDIGLRVEDLPTVEVHPNGDTRELMLGLMGYYLKPAFP